MFTLKLDASYRPVDVIDSIEALVMCIVGRAMSLEFYEEEIHSPNKTFKLPAVIVIFNIVKQMKFEPKCSRRNILIRDNYTCQYCAERFTANVLTLDHVLPRSRGGKETWKNLVTACKKCNQEKANRTPKEASMRLLKKPEMPKSIKMKCSNYMQEIWKDYIR